MFKKSQIPTTNVVYQNPADRIVDFAWQIHAAQESWTGKVDVKASILLALEGGALFAVLAASSTTGVLARLDATARVLELIGVLLILLAIASATVAVFPLLGRTKEHGTSYRNNAIYFGHIRHWDPVDLHLYLTSMTASRQTEMLSRQLVEMSKRNWKKHRWVQVSLSFAIFGVASIAAAILFGT